MLFYANLFLGSWRSLILEFYFNYGTFPLGFCIQTLCCHSGSFFEIIEFESDLSRRAMNFGNKDRMSHCFLITNNAGIKENEFLVLLQYLFIYSKHNKREWFRCSCRLVRFPFFPFGR